MYVCKGKGFYHVVCPLYVGVCLCMCGMGRGGGMGGWDLTWAGSGFVSFEIPWFLRLLCPFVNNCICMSWFLVMPFIYCIWLL